MTTLFDRIISGELPGEFIFKDARWVAFLDIKPTAFGHVLLVARQGSPFLADLPAETLGSLGAYLGRLTTVVKQVCAAPAVNVVLNDGPEAGQLIGHCHLHVIPRFEKDGRPPFSAHLEYPPGELQRYGELLRQAWSA